MEEKNNMSRQEFYGDNEFKKSIKELDYKMSMGNKSTKKEQGKRLEGDTRCNFPIDHPSSCLPSSSPPQNPQDCMSLYAGKYKITGTGYAPHCPPNYAPYPYSIFNGWMKLGSYFHSDHCDEVFKFNKLKSISINCHESNKGSQWGYPNSVNGGCGRDFEEYYTRIAQPNFNEGEYTVRIQSSESNTLTGGGTNWPWIRATFPFAEILYPATVETTLHLTMVGGGLPIIESNIPDVMNQSVDILTPSATTYIDEGGNEVASILDNPVYFYVFFEGDWGQIRPRQMGGTQISPTTPSAPVKTSSPGTTPRTY